MTFNDQPCSSCTHTTGIDWPSASGCPLCGVPSQSLVKAITLRALVKKADQNQISNPEYRICMSQACRVVYFDLESRAVFTKDQVSVRVGFKETDAPRPLCYCFDHSWESLQKEWLATGQSTAVASIRESMRSTGCHCEETNPIGTCCLADVAKALEQIQG